VSSIRFFEEYQMEMIQSDVIVQPGNSGGPLLDKNGAVIGITALGIRGAVGLNFFTPVGIALESLGVTLE
jgi:S1-C subfamily serine protease